jgi:hypothetical protein
MGQAKNRGTLAERISQAKQKKQAKADKLGYIPNSIETFQPDAGVNSKPEATNYYWFQTLEFAQDQVRKQKIGLGHRSYRYAGDRFIEMGFNVDLMDEAGKSHVIKHPDDGKGFLLSMRFTSKQLAKLADEIDKGGMSVRLSGKPAEILTSDCDEVYRVVDCEDIYSKGNDSGLMTFMVNVGGTMNTLTSKDLAEGLRVAASDLKENANA